ncbi:MAG: hypothetical protein K5871_05255 [Lachnospiraceae bacterium]|nr:hypothetical protein [Lachnospiraceae bacterium]
MFNEGIDRGSNVPKIMGVLCALAAVSITAALPAMAITIMLFSGSMDYGK